MRGVPVGDTDVIDSTCTKLESGESGVGGRVELDMGEKYP
jgi:hypothetical protein